MKIVDGSLWNGEAVHPWYSYAAEHDGDAGVGEDLVEQGGELRVPVAYQIRDGGARVLQVHREVLRGLGDPGRGRMRGGAKDADAAGGVSMAARMYWRCPVRVTVS